MTTQKKEFHLRLIKNRAKDPVLGYLRDMPLFVLRYSMVAMIDASDRVGSLEDTRCTSSRVVFGSCRFRTSWIS